MKKSNTIFAPRVNHGTEESPEIKEILTPVEMPYNETNAQIAKREAYEGKYSVDEVDDPEHGAPPTDSERITELEEALAMLLNGVTE